MSNESIDATRTFGTYQFESSLSAHTGKGLWKLDVEPALAIRMKRIFGRVHSSITGTIQVAHTIEVARDLEWLMQRWPLLPADPVSESMLTQSASDHRDRERKLHQLAVSSPQFSLPREPLKTPREYQHTAVAILRLAKRLLLTDEVGLGKTLTGLLNASFEGSLPMVVVPPTHLPRRWETEIKESFPWLTFQTVKKTTPPEGWSVEQMPDVLIVPYSRLSGWQHHLAGVARTVVFDEVQELRNGTQTVKGTAAANIAAKAEYVLGLTATPVYNYGGEIWSIYDILAPDMLGTRNEFLREWGHMISNGRIYVSSPAALGSYLREQGLLLGRTRKEVGRELPDIIKTVHQVNSDPAALDDIKGDVEKLAKMILSENTNSMERFQSAGELDKRLRQATGVAKAPYVAEFVRLLLESESKIVLFGWHRVVYDIWTESLKQFNPVLYTGTETPAQKAESEKTFINDSTCRVLIMSLRSGAGVDGLQKVAKTAVFGELDWSPQVHTQAIGRLRRDGMGDEPPVAYYLTSDTGSDPAIMEVLQVKRQQAEPLVSPDGKLFSASVPEQSRSRLLAEQILSSSTKSSL